MEFRVLGCFGAETPDHKVTGFLLNGRMLLDAGTVTGALDLVEQSRIREILLTHAHMDHVKGLPFLADNLVGKIQEPISLVGVAEVIESLRKNLFNDLLWPDFSQIPSPEVPVFQYRVIEARKETEIGGLFFTPIPVNHTVPTVGFLIRDDAGTVLFSGDTAVTEEIWRVARETNEIRAIIVETSFPNALQDLAVVSGHLTPRMLKQELAKFGPITQPIYIYHMKAQHNLDEIRREVLALGYPQLTFFEDGKTYRI